MLIIQWYIHTAVHDDNFEVGKQHEFNCTVNATGVDVNNISWIGPNGVITKLMIV